MDYLKKIIEKWKDKEYRNYMIVNISIQVGLFTLGFILGIILTKGIYSSGLENCTQYVKENCIILK